MTWGFVGAAAVSVGASVIGGTMANGKADVNAIGGSLSGQQDNQIAWENNAADNQAIREMNLQNTIRTGYRVGILNVQRGQQRKAEAQLGIGLGKNKLAALGAANANIAASGSIGSSVEAVVSDIQMQAEQADASLVDAARVAQDNEHREMTDILQAGSDALKGPKTLNIRSVQNPNLSSSGDVWAGALINVAGSYASQKMSLGLGKPAGPTGG